MCDGIQTFSIERRVIHWDRDLLAHLLHLWCHVVILSLWFLYATIRSVVNGPLVLFIHRYQHLKAGYILVSPLRQRCWAAIVSPATMTPDPPFFVTAIMTADMRLLWRHKVTVRLWICRYIVGYVRRRTTESHCVRVLSPEFIFYPCFVAHNYLFWYTTLSVDLGHVDGAPLSLVFNKFGQWYCNGLEVIGARHHAFCDVWLS